MEEKNDPKYINSLLDINQYTGLSRKRMGPIVLFLLVAGLPVLLWVYFFMQIIPYQLMLVVEALWAFRFALLILGEENRRLNTYLADQESSYHSTFELLGIRNVHEDGLVEYLNGEIGYYLIAENGNQGDKVARAQRIRSTLDRLEQSYIIDVYALNSSIGTALRSRYSKIKAFQDKDIMFDFVKFIDYVIDYADTMSYLYTNYFVIRTRRSNLKTFRPTLESIINANNSKTFKSLRILNREEVQVANSQDLGIYVDYEGLTMMKYTTGDYKDSCVEEYDPVQLDPAAFNKGSANIEEVGFIDEPED